MTLEEILAYAQQQGRGQSLFQQPTSQSYFNRGLGIGPRIAGNTVVNIDQSSSPPAPLARPESPSQARDIRQAGFATALGDLAPLLSDWRTTPAAALAAAVGGYGRGAYAARKDVAATQRAERETAAAEQTRQAQTQTAQAEMTVAQQKLRQAQAVAEEISKIEDPEERRRALIDPESWIKAKYKEQDPVKLGYGDVLLDPVTKQPIYKMGPAPQQAGQAPETWTTLTPEETKALGYGDGFVVQRSNRGALKEVSKPDSRSSGVVYRGPNGEEIQVGGSAPEGIQAVKLPQGYYMGDPSPEAKAMGIETKVATPAVGTPDYSKALDEIQGNVNFRQKLTNLRDYFSKNGATLMPGAQKGDLQSMANDLKLSYALAKGQGALQKTDEAVIENVLGAVNSLYTNLMPGGEDQALAQIERAISSVDFDVDSMATKYPWYKIKRPWMEKERQPKVEQLKSPDAGSAGTAKPEDRTYFGFD